MAVWGPQHSTTLKYQLRKPHKGVDAPAIEMLFVVLVPKILRLGAIPYQYHVVFSGSGVRPTQFPCQTIEMFSFHLHLA